MACIWSDQACPFSVDTQLSKRTKVRLASVDVQASTASAIRVCCMHVWLFPVSQAQSICLTRISIRRGLLGYRHGDMPVRIAFRSKSWAISFPLSGTRTFRQTWRRLQYEEFGDQYERFRNVTEPFEIVQEYCIDNPLPCDVRISWDGDEPWMDTPRPPTIRERFRRRCHTCARRGSFRWLRSAVQIFGSRRLSSYLQGKLAGR